MLPEDSEIKTRAIANAEAVSERHRSLGSPPEPDFAALGLRLGFAPLKAIVLDSAAFQDQEDGAAGGQTILSDALVFFAGLMEGVYTVFLQTLDGLAQQQQQPEQEASPAKRIIGEREIAGAWAARLAEWSALFVVRETTEEVEEVVQAVEAIIKEEVQYLLKIIMVQEQGTVTKLLKVESSIIIRDLTQKIKKKTLTPTQLAENRRYYLFWHDEESDDSEGLFLDDDKLLSDYPSVRNVRILIAATIQFCPHLPPFSDRTRRLNLSSRRETSKCTSPKLPSSPTLSTRSSRLRRWCRPSSPTLVPLFPPPFPFPFPALSLIPKSICNKVFVIGAALVSFSWVTNTRVGKRQPRPRYGRQKHRRAPRSLVARAVSAAGKA